MNRQFDVTSSFLMTLSFFQNQIFKDKKQNSGGICSKSYVNLILVLRLTLFLDYVTFITSVLPKNCVFTTSYLLFHVSGRKCWRQQKGQYLFKIYLTDITTTLYLKLLKVAPRVERTEVFEKGWNLQVVFVLGDAW